MYLHIALLSIASNRLRCIYILRQRGCAGWADYNYLSDQTPAPIKSIKIRRLRTTPPTMRDWIRRPPPVMGHHAASCDQLCRAGAPAGRGLYKTGPREGLEGAGGHILFKKNPLRPLSYAPQRPKACFVRWPTIVWVRVNDHDMYWHSCIYFYIRWNRMQ